MNAGSPLVIASKSGWDPPIRREHALAQLASGAGHEVTFIASPADVRALRGAERRQWLRELRTASRRRVGKIEVVRRSTVVPAHRSRAAEAVDGWLLGRQLPGPGRSPSPTLVATMPCQWPGLSGRTECRRVLDLGDDWAALIPRRASRIRDLLAQIAAQADEIVVVSPRLAELFPDRPVTVVRNGLDRALLTPLTPLPGRDRLVYVGTLSERFDAQLAGRLLDLLPDHWTLELYGPCAYRGNGSSPDAELAALLARGDGRVHWHGPVRRESLARTLDDADVLMLLNRAQQSAGQDSLKLYDYAARGRPIVATDGAMAGVTELPPRLRSASSEEELAQAAQESVGEPPEWASERSSWAAAQVWERRWPAWSEALFGKSAPPPAAAPVGAGNRGWLGGDVGT
jgi:glycosyltransferase involved in cell wall biosynthesis